MAKDEANQNISDEAPRVYKASDVHKRRAEPSSPDKPKTFRFSRGKSVTEASPEDKPEAEDFPNSGSDASRSPEDGHDPAGAEAFGDRQMPTGAGAFEEGRPSADDHVQEGESAVSEPMIDDEGASDAPESAQEDAGSFSNSQADEGFAGEKPKKGRWKLLVAVIVGVVVAVLLVLAGYMAGSRWVRFNDEDDIQGNWYVYGTEVPLAIGNGEISINDETAYAYRIDPTAKTIEYTFGGMAGQGRYWFSDDRKILVITDGKDYTMWSTLLDDLSYDLARLFGRTGLPTTDTSIVLSRSVMQAPEPASEEPAVESSAAPTGDESSEMLKVSDIMLEEETDSDAEEL